VRSARMWRKYFAFGLSDLLAIEAPGTVCILAGQYQGNVQMRDGVNLSGTGSNTVLCGSINADASINLGSKISNMSIAGQVGAVGSVNLNLIDLDVGQPTPGCNVAFQQAVQLKRQGPGGFRFAASNVRVGSPGFYLSIMPAGSPLDDVIRITQSRCVVNSNQCYDFLQLNLDTQPGEQLALGSRLDVDVQVLVRHNTLTSMGDPNYAISFWETPGVPIVVANNVISYIGHPIFPADSAQLTKVANSLSSDVSSKAWFENFDSGNYRPSVGSPLVAAGDASFGTDVDIDGNPRVGHFDVGAYQR